MRNRRNNTVILFCFLTAINLLIFFYRDHFIYHEYGNYSSLYTPDTLVWKRLIDDYPKRELDEAKNILDHSINIKGQPASVKIQEIGKFLYNRFHKQTGKASHLLAASPLQQYKILTGSDSVTLWCGNFADMFVFFCWAEGIPSRIVEIKNPRNHHVLNESYLPEKGEWVMTDVMNNHLLLWDQNSSRYENLLRLRDSTPVTLVSRQAADDSVITQPFQNHFYDRFFGDKNPVYYYYQLNIPEIYRPAEKIKRYFLPVAWYVEVDPRSKDNRSFYIKQFFILLWLISLILLIKRIIRPKKSRLS